MIDYNRISSTLRNFGEGKHRINKKDFENDWTNRSLAKEDLAKKYNLKNSHEVDKFAAECNLSSRHSWEARFEKNNDEEVRKILNHVYTFNDIGISISKIEESGVGSRKKIFEMIDSGYLVLGDSILNNEKVIFLNPNLKPRYFSIDLRKFKQMYLNPEVTTKAISNRLRMNDMSAVSRIAKGIGIPVREWSQSADGSKFSKLKNEYKKLWSDSQKTHAEIAEELEISVFTSHNWRQKLELLPRTQHHKGQTSEQFLIKILEENNGAMSLDDFQKSVYFQGAKNDTNYLVNIFKITHNTEKISTLRLPVWLLSKVLRVDNGKYNRPQKHLGVRFFTQYAIILDDIFKMIENKKFQKATNALQELQGDHEFVDPKMLDNVLKLQIFYLSKHYDSLLLKIAEIITKIKSINMEDIPEALNDFSIYDNSRGTATVTQVIMKKNIPLLKELVDDEKKLKEFQKGLKSKKVTKSPPFNENDNTQIVFSKLTSNIHQNSLKELLSQTHDFQIINNKEKKQVDGYATGFSCIVDTRKIFLFLPDSQQFKQLIEQTFENGDSPRDLLRRMLKCDCYHDGDIIFLCPHCHFALWNLYCNNLLEKTIIQDVIENLEFLMRYVCKLEDIIFEDFIFSDMEFQSIVSLLENNELSLDTIPLGFEKHMNFWKEITKLDLEKKNLLMNYIKSQKNSNSNTGSDSQNNMQFRNPTREEYAMRGEIQKRKEQKNHVTKCPACGKTADSIQDIDKLFGFRNMSGFIRSQSWCRDCRKNKS